MPEGSPTAVRRPPSHSRESGNPGNPESYQLFPQVAPVWILPFNVLGAQNDSEGTVSEYTPLSCFTFSSASGIGRMSVFHLLSERLYISSLIKSITDSPAPGGSFRISAALSVS